MKKIKTALQAALCAALLLQTLPVLSAAAEGDTVYGTMQIPYNDFFAAEGVSHEVDAVSSATTSKWKNENLVAGTYAAEGENGGGTILGVVYPVAISQADLDALGENNYGFTALTEVPAAYKEVSVTDGAVSFSEVKGATAAIESVEATITTNTNYGDYCIDAAVGNANGTSDIGVIYGILVHTANGETYAMRHLENIWRDEIAWSVGFVTETHGNTLVYDDYAALAGQTVTQLTYITDSGYHTLAVNLYAPLKFANTLTVENADIQAGTAAVSMDGFPADYAKSYTVDGLDSTVSDTAVTFADALPGTYTLTVSDTSGVYAPVSTRFTLTTDGMPAKAEGNGLAKADGASEEDYINFVKNISTVTVGENSYRASGKHSTVIIGTDGAIDPAAGGEEPVFAEDGTYTLRVASDGYTTELVFDVMIANGTVSAAASAASETPAPVPAAEETVPPVVEAPVLTAAEPQWQEPTTAPQTADLLLFPALAAIGAGIGAIVSKRKKK